MVYAISQDMEEVYQNPDKWENKGRQILESSCKHKTQDKEETNLRYSGYCDECGISEDSAIPMMNFLYPLELNSFDDEKILKVVKETNCSVLENTETEKYFIVLCGGGMDLSQDIAFAFQILETWLPSDLLREVCKQPCLSLGSENYKKLARGIIEQLKIEADRNKQKAKEWKESLKNLKEKEKAKVI